MASQVLGGNLSDKNLLGAGTKKISGQIS